MGGRLNKWFGNIWLSVGHPEFHATVPGCGTMFLLGSKPASQGGRKGVEREGGVEAVTLLPVMALGPCSSFDFFGVCVRETESTPLCVCVCACAYMYVFMHVRMYVCVPVLAYRV